MRKSCPLLAPAQGSRLFLEISREAPIQPSHSHSLRPADPPIFSPQKLRRLLTFPQLFAKIVIPKEHETLFARDVVILELLPCTMPPTSLLTCSQGSCRQ
jgi:hypothetical protein